MGDEETKDGGAPTADAPAAPVAQSAAASPAAPTPRRRGFRWGAFFWSLLVFAAVMGLLAFLASRDGPPQPPGDPISRPADPVDPPAEPVDPPTDPEDPPAEPVDPPADPVDPPADPVDPPADPVDPPADPVDPPTDPVDPPADPVDPPADPVDPPADPVDPPADPVDPPADPVDPPADPVDPPADPVDPPADPVDPPADPVDPPADPVDPPADPVDPGDPLIPPPPTDPMEPVDPEEPVTPEEPPAPNIPSDAELFGPPGGLVAGSGRGVEDDTIYAEGLRYPLEATPSFPNSQVYGVGGFKGPRGGQCDTRNYTYPWRDNFCETRGYKTRLCPNGKGHQGQDIRPATCEKDKHWAVAVESGTVTHLGSYTVTLVGASGREYRYMHLNMRKLRVRKGDRVLRGDRIGLVSNFFGGTPTTIHLHFEIRQVIRNADGSITKKFVPPYTSLKDSYRRLLISEAAATEAAEAASE